MKLQVPIKYQGEGTGDCGLVSAQMILAYYGIEKKLEDIKKEITLHLTGDGTFGSYSPQWAMLFIKNGFEVELNTLHPKLFTKQDTSLTQSAVKNRLKESKKKYQSKSDELALNYFLEFMNVGGRINVQIPSIQLLENEISQKRPVIINYTNNFVLGKEPKMNFHAAVVTGVDERHVYINDPLPDGRGGKQKYTHEDYLFATYGSMAGDLDNTVQIMISKNE